MGTNDLEYFEAPKKAINDDGLTIKTSKKCENMEKLSFFSNFSLVLVIQRLRPRLEG